MKKRRVMHGLSEVAGQGIYSVLGLRELGEDAQMIVWTPNPFGYPYDKTLNIDKNKKKLLPLYGIKIICFLFYSLFRYDIFQFHYGRSFLFNKEINFLKFFHKKVFYEFHGSDLRNYKIANKRNKYFILEENERNQEKIKKRVMKICKKADGIIIHDYELRAYLPKTQQNIFYIPLRMNVDSFQPTYPDTKGNKIKIVHAPSNAQIKGTEYVIKAIDNLKERYPIDFILVQNMTQDEAKEIYRKADIVVDQLIIGTYGVFALESMALGKPVITYIMKDMVANFPDELPIQSATIDNIEDVLERLILSSDLRYELGVAGRKYVEKYHDYKKIAAYLKKIYEGKQKPVSARKAFGNVKKISVE